LSFSPTVEIDQEKHRKKIFRTDFSDHTSPNTRSNSRKIKRIGPCIYLSVHPSAELLFPSDKFLLAFFLLRAETLYKIFTKLYCDDLINVQNLLHCNYSPNRRKLVRSKTPTSA